MPTELLTIGPVTTILAGVVYAMPARKVTAFAVGTGLINVANTQAMTGSTTVPAGQFTNSAGFISPTTTGTISLKAD